MLQIIKNTLGIIVLTGITIISITVINNEVLAEEISKPFETFTVYKDKPSRNHYAASGYMPVGKCVTIDDAYREGCQWGKSCIKVIFDGACATVNLGWAGAYWLDPANNWGDEKGGFDLTGAQQLTFWARGEKGGEMINFKMGGSGMNHKYADTDTAGIGPLSLSKEWREYSINLKNKNLSRIIGGFAFVANAKFNPGQTVFYIDEIYYK